MYPTSYSQNIVLMFTSFAIPTDVTIANYLSETVNLPKDQYQIFLQGRSAKKTIVLAHLKSKATQIIGYAKSDIIESQKAPNINEDNLKKADDTKSDMDEEKEKAFAQDETIQNSVYTSKQYVTKIVLLDHDFVVQDKITNPAAVYKKYLIDNVTSIVASVYEPGKKADEIKLDYTQNDILLNTMLNGFFSSINFTDINHERKVFEVIVRNNITIVGIIYKYILNNILQARELGCIGKLSAAIKFLDIFKLVPAKISQMPATTFSENVSSPLKEIMDLFQKQPVVSDSLQQLIMDIKRGAVSIFNLSQFQLKFQATTKDQCKKENADSQTDLGRLRKILLAYHPGQEIDKIYAKYSQDYFTSPFQILSSKLTDSQSTPTRNLSCQQLFEISHGDKGKSLARTIIWGIKIRLTDENANELEPINIPGNMIVNFTFDTIQNIFIPNSLYISNKVITAIMENKDVNLEDQNIIAFAALEEQLNVMVNGNYPVQIVTQLKEFLNRNFPDLPLKDQKDIPLDKPKGSPEVRGRMVKQSISSTSSSTDAEKISSVTPSSNVLSILSSIGASSTKLEFATTIKIVSYIIQILVMLHETDEYIPNELEKLTYHGCFVRELLDNETSEVVNSIFDVIDKWSFLKKPEFNTFNNLIIFLKHYAAKTYQFSKFSFYFDIYAQVRNGDIYEFKQLSSFEKRKIVEYFYLQGIAIKRNVQIEYLNAIIPAERIDISYLNEITAIQDRSELENFFDRVGDSIKFLIINPAQLNSYLLDIIRIKCKNLINLIIQSDNLNTKQHNLVYGVPRSRTDIFNEKLTSLSLVNCPYTEFSIKAPSLEAFKALNCPNLDLVTISDGKKLDIVNISACPNARFYNDHPDLLASRDQALKFKICEVLDSLIYNVLKDKKSDIAWNQHESFKTINSQLQVYIKTDGTKLRELRGFLKIGSNHAKVKELINNLVTKNEDILNQQTGEMIPILMNHNGLLSKIFEMINPNPAVDATSSSNLNL